MTRLFSEGWELEIGYWILDICLFFRKEPYSPT
jgi:hypothetical protein